MSLQLAKAPTRPVKPVVETEEIRLRADALFRAEEFPNLRSVIAEKIKDLGRYDVLAMQTVVAILMWGRSGSLLLASYLDGHDDVILLPELGGWRLNEFFERFQSLSLRDKLLAYPAFLPEYTRFFEGDFAISKAQYYAAVQAIVEVYDSWPAEFLESRRAFFLFVHIAYNLALGRRLATSHPVIVYQQHDRDDVMASHLVEDFPQTKFVHTIRDPISSYSGIFRYVFDGLDKCFPRSYTLAPYWTLYYLTVTERPHLGMESRTRTVRFEDLHGNLAETMHDLSAWLGLSYQATLLDSTFNGIPWIVKRGGVAWTGPRLENVQRRAPDLSPKDHALLYALFYENFISWNYPCPKIFKYRAVRCAVAVSLFLFPVKTEMIAARKILKRRLLPALRHGNMVQVIKSLAGIGLVRLKMMWLLMGNVLRRCTSRTALLKVRMVQEPAEERATAHPAT